MRKRFMRWLGAKTEALAIRTGLLATPEVSAYCAWADVRQDEIDGVPVDRR